MARFVLGAGETDLLSRTHKGYLTAFGVALAVAVPADFLLEPSGVLSACPQVPDGIPDWVVAAALWAVPLAPVLGLVAGVVVSRRARAQLPSDGPGA